MDGVSVVDLVGSTAAGAVGCGLAGCEVGRVSRIGGVGLEGCNDVVPFLPARSSITIGGWSSSSTVTTGPLGGVLERSRRKAEGAGVLGAGPGVDGAGKGVCGAAEGFGFLDPSKVTRGVGGTRLKIWDSSTTGCPSSLTSGSLHPLWTHQCSPAFHYQTSISPLPSRALAGPILAPACPCCSS